MLCEACDPFDEIFMHYDDEDGRQEVWNTTKLVAHVEASKLESVPVQIDDEHARYCIEQRGFEVARLKAFVEDPELVKKPIVFIHKPDDSHLLVDGTHRYVLYWKLGAKRIPAYIVPFDVAQPFLIEDYPEVDEDVAMSEPSRIPALRAIKKALDS